MNKIFGLWNVEKIFRDDEPDITESREMAWAAYQHGKDLGLPLFGAKVSVLRLDAHIDAYGGICLLHQGVYFGEGSRLMLEAYVAERSKSQPKWNPYVVSFVFDVDTSG